MFEVLDYSVEFPTTGRQFANRIEFAPGLTTITGRNEAGKSLILEMLAYCLFGKAALRGAASDYRNLTASLSLKVGKQKVQISRSRRSETMLVDGKQHAVGAEAINRAVPQLLGFGLDVFNIACAAQQGDLDALTQMRPTARRAMVDQLVGLDRLEEVERECRAEARAHNTMAENLAANLRAPEEPFQPDNYRPSSEIEEELTNLREKRIQRENLLRIPEPVTPCVPEVPAETDVTALEQHEAARQVQLQARARIEGQLVGMPRLLVKPEDLEKAIRWRDTKAELERRGERPSFPISDLKEMEKAWEIRARAGDEAECPACSHRFHVGISHEEEKYLEGEIFLNQRQIAEEYRRHEMWAEPLEPCEIFEIKNLDSQIRAWECHHLRAELEAQLEEPLMEDKSAALREARAYAQAMAIYETRLAQYDQQLEDYIQAQELLATMEDPSAGILQLEDQLVYSRDYERRVERFQIEQEQYEAASKDIEEARARADSFTRGARALSETRVAVKAELAPSLSVAASSLIASMTGGERRSVVVDEDFEVVVDGQPLRTLSGSGKSVVNLALRLAMGQVLTSRVLPVFLGDEINADMDAERAGTTQQTMLALREYLTQIILVTHREIEADQKIEL